MAEEEVLPGALTTTTAVDTSSYGLVYRPAGSELEKAALPVLVAAGAYEASGAGRVPKADSGGLLDAAYLGTGTADVTVGLRGDRAFAADRITVRERDLSPSLLATILELDGRLCVEDAGGGIARASVRKPHDVAQIFDDFVSGTLTSGGIGSLGWSGTFGTLARVASTAAHPGILRLSTTSSANNVARLHSALAGTDGPVNIGATESLTFVLRIPTITTVRLRVGLAADHSAYNGGASFVGFDFDSATSAFWRTVTRSASTETVNATATTVTANNWYVLRVAKNGSGNFEFYVNGATTPAFTHSTNLPSGALSWGASIETLAASVRDLDLDLMSWMTGPLTRWT